MSHYDPANDPDADEYDEPIHTFIIEREPSRRRALIAFVLSVVMVVLWTHNALNGDLTFSNGWAVALGAALGVWSIFGPGSYLFSFLTTLAVFVGIAVAAPASVYANAQSGLLTLVALAAALLLIAQGLTWGTAFLGWALFRWDTRQTRGRRFKQSWVDEGLSALESYLACAAETMEPLTRQKMAEGRRKIIGLSGYSGSGKDTVAASLIIDKDYTKVSFGDPIRAMLYATNPQVRNGHVWLRIRELVDAVGWPAAQDNDDVRRMLQDLGETGRRLLGEDVWVNATMANLPEGNIVVTSVRFPNEAQKVRELGGYVVRVTRPGVGPKNNHITDTALDGWDFDAAVINEGTPAEGRRQLLNVEEVLYDSEPAV